MSDQKLNKRRALATLEQAQLHLGRGELEQAEALARAVRNSGLKSNAAYGLLADVLERRGKQKEAIAALEQGLAAIPHDAELLARLGALQVQEGDAAAGLKSLEKARAKLGRDPGFLTHLGLALMRAGREEEAEEVLERALQLKAGDDARIILAMVKGRRGRFEAADALVAGLESSAQEPLRIAAMLVRADVRLFLNDAKGALTRFKAVEAKGRIEPEQLGHFAYAAQLAGEPLLADQLIARRLEGKPTAEDHLLFAQIALARGKAGEALERLEAAQSAEGQRFKEHDFEVLTALGKAFRLLGRADEARRTLQAALKKEGADNARLGPRAHVELGHLHAEAGDFRKAEEHFSRALELDPQEPEAQRGLELTRRKTAWKTELEASAEARIEAVQAEARALERQFVSGQSELERMKRELEQLKSAQKEALERARKAEEVARAAADRARDEQRKKLREELALREEEANAKAVENLDRALGDTKPHCPQELATSLLVAERTFQRALFTELPAGSVAVMYSGALERGLFLLYVKRFDAWLAQQGRRQAFLDGATREKRGKRAEYFDKFVEAFDESLTRPAPSLGEVARVLGKLGESYLAPLKQFLEQTYAAPLKFYAELADFVDWTRVELREPSAHGRFDEVSYETLKPFREQMLFGFKGWGKGVLPMLVAPRA